MSPDDSTDASSRMVRIGTTEVALEGVLRGAAAGCRRGTGRLLVADADAEAPQRVPAAVLLGDGDLHAQGLVPLHRILEHRGGGARRLHVAAMHRPARPGG